VGEAVNHMARHGVGRLPVMSRVDPARMVGILSRSDVLRVLERAAREREVAPQERGAKAPASARAG
jgi:CBS domain-containing protein